jgi:translocation and assembly module TamB
LRNYPLDAAGTLSANKKSIYIKELYLSSGASRLDVSGTLGETLSLAWRLDSPKLAELYPQAQGRFSAQGQLTGNRAAPRIDAKLDGAGIAIDKTRIRELKGDVVADLRAGQGFKVELNARDLVLAKREITSIGITGGGSTERHQLEAKLDGKDQDLSLRIDGGLKHKQWTGQLLKLDLSDRKLGNWALVKPARLQAATGAVEFQDPLCFSHDAARLCARGSWNASAGWAGDVRSESFPLALLAPVLPAGMQVTGILSGSAAASGLGGAIKTASADLKAYDGRFERKPLQGEALKLGFREIHARLNQQGRGARADVDLDLTEPAGTTGTIHLETAAFDPARLDFKTLPLKGTLRMRLPHAESLVKYSNEIKNLKGAIDADLQFSGNLAKPQIGGSLDLSKGGVSLPKFGLTIKDIALRASGTEGQTLAISGSAKSGDGLLKITGQVDPSLRGERPVVLKLSGDRVQVMHLPEAEVAVSPIVNLTYQPQRLALTGLIRVPKAKLQPQKSAKAVPKSKDVRVLGEQAEAQAVTPAGLATTADIRVEMGQDVQVKAQGFEGKLEGAVRIIKGLTGPVNGVGELFVRKGEYAMYGQKLTIDPGRVIFTGGPIDEPALDIRATRKVDNIVAGARIQGPLKQPVTTLYSEPSLPQDQILSYLVLGRRVDKLTSGDGDMLMSAASALGFKEGEAVTKRIADTLGLDDVKFENRGGANAAQAGGTSPQANTALVIGKYLTPKLYVSYGLGLFRAFNSVRLRYIFGKHWSLETETGAQTGVDLLYSIER